MKEREKLYISVPLFFKDCIYLTERDNERGNISMRRGRGRSGLPAEEGAQCGAQFPDPGIMT